MGLLLRLPGVALRLALVFLPAAAVLGPKYPKV